METKELRAVNYSDPSVVQTIRETVAIGATDAELAMFLELARATGLNPFKREIWFIKAGGRPQIMTGINGFHAIANRSVQYDGIESGLISPTGELVSAAYPNADYIGAWCRVHRKDRRVPTEGIAMLNEYDKGQGNWSRMRRVMINKCAESIALRKAFPQELGGLYTAEEMPLEFAQPPESRPEPKPIPQNLGLKPASILDGARWYDLSLIAEDKRAEAMEYAEANGGALDAETSLYVSPKPLKKLAKAEVPPPSDDDIPDSWKTPGAA